MAEIRSQADFFASTRATLTAAGLERCELDGIVYWSGGGSASTLVLIHGANDHAGTWCLAAQRLIRTHHLIVPDLPGHGESEPRSGPIHMRDMVESIGKLLDHEGAARATLAGNSMGAWIAILYTLAHPERVDRLVLESGGGLSVPLGVPLVATEREAAMTILRAVHGPDAPIPEWAVDALLARSKDSPMLRLVPLEMYGSLVDKRLGEITAPTTIVWGAHDGVVTRQYVDQLHAGIRGSSLCVIDDAAHIPHMQQPERFVACLPATF